MVASIWELVVVFEGEDLGENSNVGYARNQTNNRKIYKAEEKLVNWKLLDITSIS